MSHRHLEPRRIFVGALFNGTPSGCGRRMRYSRHHRLRLPRRRLPRPPPLSTAFQRHPSLVSLSRAQLKGILFFLLRNGGLYVRTLARGRKGSEPLTKGLGLSSTASPISSQLKTNEIPLDV